MSIASDRLPLTETLTPADQAEAAALVRQAYEAETPLYPIGGGTALEFGLPARLPGLGLSLAGLNRVVDYPARDMTITVEAGIRMTELIARLAEAGQRLPVDAAQAEAATLGGVVATNFSGPRRYGHGTIRDYVIGISAVDGRGTPFKGGGRVVKNVAGYDFCKLLCGSLGTLAVITQVTLKVKPLPEATAFLSCEVADSAQAEPLLAALVQSQTTPVAIELAAGPLWQAEPVSAGNAARLLVGFEGSTAEVDWQLAELRREWQTQDAPGVVEHAGKTATSIWSQLTQFACASDAGLVVKANVLPSATTRFMQLCRELDPQVSLLAHAGNGIVLASFPEFSPADTSNWLIKRLQPAAAAASGNLVVWSRAGGELTRQAVWGVTRDDAEVMRAVKRQFDPRGLLNPGRFVYGTP
ncbi:MAG TPA: FAD-binding oxidoreductase [Pirellulales bacterium]|nr:FAD-binding oxidoreductase [Pirellulales bacterium]